VCDLCGRKVSIEEQTSVYSDDMTADRDTPGWVSDFPVPPEHRVHDVASICIACPVCKKETRWENYVEDRV
jgi:hypothetical protein